MNRKTFGAIAAVCGFATLAGVRGVAAAAQAPTAASAPAGQVVEATVCDVVGHPDRYDGKTLRVSGTVQVGVDSFLMRGDTCGDALWLSYPAGTRAKAGPATVVSMQFASNATATPAKQRPPVTLQMNPDFQNFDKLLSEKAKTPGVCLGCVKNNVKATLVGRLDGTLNTGLTRDSSGKITGLDGFGNMNQYGARLVIESVSNVTAEPIDFAKAAKVANDNQGAGDKDYSKLVTKAEAAYPKGSPSANQLQAAIDAFGKPGEDNGVVVAFGQTADVPDGEGAKAAKSAPDGVLITARFDPDKLKGFTMSLAAVQDGAEINDLRAKDQLTFAHMEHDAWQMVLLQTIGSRQKSLTVPGGTVLWTESWPAADRSNNAETALQQYLIDHEQQGQ